MVRRQLRLLLGAGVNPMHMFSRDIKVRQQAAPRPARPVAAAAPLQPRVHRHALPPLPLPHPSNTAAANPSNTAAATHSSPTSRCAPP